MITSAIMRGENAQNQHFGHFSSRRLLKKFSDKILLDNSMTLILKKKTSKNYSRKEITFKDFKLFIFRLLVFFLIYFFYNANFENDKI